MNDRKYLYLVLVLLSASVIWIFIYSSRGGDQLGDHNRIGEYSRDAAPSTRQILNSRDPDNLSSRVETELKVTIKDMPLEIDEWKVSTVDRKIFKKLSDLLLESEVSRVIDESHCYDETKVTDEDRMLLGVAEGIDLIEVLHVTAALRPPDPQELGEINTLLDGAIAKSSVSDTEKDKIRMFFEERFSLKDQRYKIIDTNATKLGGGDKVTRFTYVMLCDEFITEGDGEEGERRIGYTGSFEIEESYTNPAARVNERYGHLVDTEAGE